MTSHKTQHRRPILPHTKLSIPFISQVHHKKALSAQQRSYTIHLLILIGVFMVVFVTNFSFFGWFSGWDNLHPEYGFWINFKRAFSSVWQANQGLGTFGGHGYASTLPHTILLWVSSLIVPLENLRSYFTLMTLLIGSAGVYILFCRITVFEKNYRMRHAAALLAGLFYMLNLATIQNYYVQLEAFITHYAALPWLFFFLITVLERPSVRNIGIYAVVSFFASQQGFVPPLFFVYAILLCIFLGFYLIMHLSWQNFLKTFLIGLLTLAINAYWLFPVAYYSQSGSDAYLNAYNNILSTEDFILKNKKYGDIENVSLLKGFYVESVDAALNGSYFQIFGRLNAHLSDAGVQYIGFAMFAIVLMGLAYFMFIGVQKRRYAYLAVVGGFFFTFTFLATNTYPFAQLSEFFQETIPVFRQAFRVAFTKFSLSVGFFYALGYGAGVLLLLRLFVRVQKQAYQRLLVSAFLGLGMFLQIYFSWPAVAGNFLYERMKLNVPDAYFTLFEFFREQDKTERIANFPQSWNFGWNIYNWGYSGSGFLWYGIEQPILDRSFDSWGEYNENYYWEVAHALYSKNYQRFDDIFEKYRVTWVMYDPNAQPYQTQRDRLAVSDLVEHLKSSDKYTSVKEIAIDQPYNFQTLQPLIVFRVNLEEEPQGYTEIVPPGKMTHIQPLYNYTNIDYAYLEYGDYYTDLESTADVYYPFRSLFSGRRPVEAEEPVRITKAESGDILLEAPLPEEYRSATATHSAVFTQYEDIFNTDVNILDDSVRMRLENPQPVYASGRDEMFFDRETSNCFTNQSIPGQVYEKTPVDGQYMRFFSENSDQCYTLELEEASQRYGYLMGVTHRAIEGKTTRIELINKTSQRRDLDMYLSPVSDFTTEYMFQPPMNTFGLNYSLRFRNTSILPGEPTTNDIRQVVVYPFPYQKAATLKFQGPLQSPSEQPILAYYQSYDEHWKAYSVPNYELPITNWFAHAFPFWFGEELTEHVVVNNWANGWKLESGTAEEWKSGKVENYSTVIIFWPQYIQYAGFAILFVIFGGLGIAGVVVKVRELKSRKAEKRKSRKA